MGSYQPLALLVRTDFRTLFLSLSVTLPNRKEYSDVERS